MIKPNTFLRSTAVLGLLLGSCGSAESPESTAPTPEPARILIDLKEFQGMLSDKKMVKVAGTIRVNPVYWNSDKVVVDRGYMVNTLADEHPELGLDTASERNKCSDDLEKFNPEAFDKNGILLEKIRPIFIESGTCGSKEVQ